jgi:hypothetical protein
MFHPYSLQPPLLPILREAQSTPSHYLSLKFILILSFNRELEELIKGENIVKWIKGAKDKLVGSPGENGG